MLMQNGNHNDTLRNDTMKHIIPNSKEQINAIEDENISNNLKMDQGTNKFFFSLSNTFRKNNSTHCLTKFSIF